MPENIFPLKNISKGSNCFPGKKSKWIIFHLKCTKPKQNSELYIAGCHSEYYSTDLLDFNFKVLDYLPCTCKRPIQNNFWA